MEPCRRFSPHGLAVPSAGAWQGGVAVTRSCSRLWDTARRVEADGQVLRLDVQDEVLAGCPGGAGAAAPSGGLVPAVEAELDAAGRRRSCLGQAALLLARRVESDRDGGSAVAALVRQLGLTMEAALAGGRVAHSPSADTRDEIGATSPRPGARGARE